MAAEPRILHLSPDDDLVLALKRAARDRQLLIVKTGEDVIEIGSISTHADTNVDAVVEEPDAILGLIGILDTSEPSNIAECKDQYIADAIDPRPR